MIARILFFGALLVVIAVVVVGVFMVTEPRRPPASPAAAASPSVSLAAPATPARTASATAPPTATPSPSPAPASPGSTPATACPVLTGGSAANQVQLSAIRVAHQPGFDRLVFELGPSTAPGAYGMPPYRIEVATSFVSTSGQAVRMDGNALFGVRFQNASTVSPTDGARTYTGPSSIRPTAPLIREVRLIEDFERTLTWGVGLERLQCPQILTLTGPVRLVLDFPTPP